MAHAGALHAGPWRDYMQGHHYYMVAKKVRRLDGLQLALRPKETFFATMLICAPLWSVQGPQARIAGRAVIH